MKTGFENSSNKTVLVFRMIGTIVSVIGLLVIALSASFAGDEAWIVGLVAFVYSGLFFAMACFAQVEMKKRNYSKEEVQSAKKITMTVFVIFALVLCTCIIIAFTAGGGSKIIKTSAQFVATKEAIHSKDHVIVVSTIGMQFDG